MRSDNQPIISYKEFKEELDNWVNETQDPEAKKNRNSAKKIILTQLDQPEKQFGREILNLSNLELTSFPPGIEKLGFLQELNLSNNQITEIPSELGNLIYLDLSHNQIKKFSSELGKISNLDLSYNQITEIPSKLGNLIYLDLSHNQITKISTFTKKREEALFLSLKGNPIYFAENTLADLKELNIDLEITNYELPTIIIEKFPQDRREDVEGLFQDKNFYEFISKCSSTAGWQNNHKVMLDSLTSLVLEMTKNEGLKEKCFLISIESNNACEDRIALNYVKMLLTKNVYQKPLAEMSAQELFQCGKQEAVIKFLEGKAEERIKAVKQFQNKDYDLLNTELMFLKKITATDEVETHLAYLQAAKLLEIELPASEMTYSEYSNVDSQDLLKALDEFNSYNINELVAKQIYEDEYLKTHPEINQIITASYDEIFSQKLEYEAENDEDYRNRLKNVMDEFKKEIVAKIFGFLTTQQKNEGLDINEILPIIDKKKIAEDNQKTRFVATGGQVINRDEAPPSTSILSPDGLTGIIQNLVGICMGRGHN